MKKITLITAFLILISANTALGQYSQKQEAALYQQWEQERAYDPGFSNFNDYKNDVYGAYGSGDYFNEDFVDPYYGKNSGAPVIENNYVPYVQEECYGCDQYIYYEEDKYTDSYYYAPSYGQTYDYNYDTATYNYAPSYGQTQDFNYNVGSYDYAPSYGQTYNFGDSSNDLYVSCYPNKYKVKKGEQVSWTVSALQNSSYRWEGPGVDNMTSRIATTTYSSTGEKEVFINISTGDQNTRFSCGSVFVENNPLNISCRAEPSYIEEGGTVNWIADISGGDNSYDIEWKGHDEIDNKNGDNIVVRYEDPGSYYADIEVTSGNQTRTIYCGNASVSGEYRSSIYGSCYPDKRYIGIDEKITWKANVSGGKGNYDYDWRGTGNIDGSSKNSVDVRYSGLGSKYAEVEVCSDGECLDLKCGNILVSEKPENDTFEYSPEYANYSNLEGSCISDKVDVLVGEEVTWQANVNQEISSSLFVWNGTDNINGKRGERQVIRYSTPGAKEASFSVRTDTGELFTFTCPNKINVRPGEAGTGVLSLGQVPYTGPGDVLKTMGLILLLMLWSFVTVIVIRRRIGKRKVSKIIETFKHKNIDN